MFNPGRGRLQQISLGDVDGEVRFQEWGQLINIQVHELIGLAELVEVLTDEAEDVVSELGETEGVGESEDITTILKIEIGVEIPRTLRYHWLNLKMKMIIDCMNLIKWSLSVSTWSCEAQNNTDWMLSGDNSSLPE